MVKLIATIGCSSGACSMMKIESASMNISRKTPCKKNVASRTSQRAATTARPRLRQRTSHRESHCQLRMPAQVRHEAHAHADAKASYHEGENESSDFGIGEVKFLNGIEGEKRERRSGRRIRPGE